MNKILIIEDDTDIAKLEKDYIAAAGYDVEVVGLAKEATEKIRADDYDLIVLDVMLPDADGYELCGKIRKFSDIPIILVTARSETADIIKGLGLGSDDYVTKPFDPAVLVARVKSAIERYKRHKNLGREVRVQKLKILPRNRQVFWEKTEINFTEKEFDMLYFLASRAGEVFSKEDLFEEIWGLDSLTTESTVTVYINRLREKLEKAGAKDLIATVWGVGYKVVK